MRGRFTHRLAVGVCAALTPVACTVGSTPAPDPFLRSAAPASTVRDIFLAPHTRTVAGSVPRQATLASLLDYHQLQDVAYTLIDEIRTVFDPRRLRVDHPYRLIVDRANGVLHRFEYHVDDDQFLRATRAGAGFEAELVRYAKERRTAVVRGGIDGGRSSLFAAIDAGGEGIGLAVGLAEVLSGEIDFNNDLRRGDHFRVLFEKVYREDRFAAEDPDGLSFAGYGDVLAVEFVNDGRRLRAFRYQVPGDPDAQYFDEQGRSMKRLFLRSPFRFEPRVTSHFSYRRVHPVLGGVRPHLGVDYGAPTGTPVIAVATGTVVSASRSGGSGNMVRLRHTNGYETYYLHLSAFARGIRPGARVMQGDVIGRVGSTGLSTGPHLDYRMRKEGRFVNPLLEHRNLPPGDPVPAAHLEAFRAVRDAALGRMGVEGVEAARAGEVAHDDARAPVDAAEPSGTAASGVGGAS